MYISIIQNLKTLPSTKRRPGRLSNKIQVGEMVHALSTNLKINLISRTHGWKERTIS